MAVCYSSLRKRRQAHTLGLGRLGSVPALPLARLSFSASLSLYFPKYEIEWLNIVIFKSKGNSVTYCQNRDTSEYEKLLVIIPGWDFPGGSVVKNLTGNTGDTRDTGSVPGLGRFPGGVNGN